MLSHLTRQDKEALRIAKMGYWEYDVATGMFTFNDQYYSLHGITTEEAGGYEMSAQEFATKYVPAYDSHTVGEAIRRGIETQDPDFQDLFEAHIMRADGSPRNVIVWFRIEKDAQNKTVKLYGVNQDITERQQLRNETETRRLFLESILRSAPDAIVTSDIHHKILEWNPGAEKLFGYSAQEACGHRIDELITGSDPLIRDEATSWTQQIQKFDDIPPTETVRYRKDGTAVNVIVSVAPLFTAEEWVGVVAVYSDITERKRSEEALQQANLVVENSPVVLFRWKACEGWPVELVSKNVTQFGYTPEELLSGKVFFSSIVHPEDISRVVGEVTEYGQKGINNFQQEYRLITKDGKVRWVDDRTMVERDADGRITHYQGIVIDISDRKQAEEEIQRLNAELEGRVSERTAQLEAANKELEAFAYSVSHDLRAPLRAIDGYSKILIEDFSTNLEADAKQVCAVISSEANRMGQLIDDLLAFSRVSRVELQVVPVDMDALVKSVYQNLIESEKAEGIKLHLAALPQALADPALIQQVWTNLLANAIKFSRQQQPAVIEVGGAQGRQEITYWVRDNGAGFDMRFVGKLFRVFQRLHSEHEFEGTGVGLAIVQRVIQRHGGRVWASGEVERGATFSFTLPHVRKNP